MTRQSSMCLQGSVTNLGIYRLSPNQIQKLLNQYLVADYEQPINGEIMKAVASKVNGEERCAPLAGRRYG